MDKILILDFGSQTTQLIARRIREIGVYTDTIPGDTPFEEKLLSGVRGLIFSGSPFSVHEEDAPTLHGDWYKAALPILGICYGFQRMTWDHGGRVESLGKREFGRSRIEYAAKSPLFAGIPGGFTSWMSHGDSIGELAPGFRLSAQSEHHLASAHWPERRFYGIQFHPEVTHCDYGNQILENFVCAICDAKKTWNMEAYLEEVSRELAVQAHGKNVLLLISGGVDSTVLGGVLLRVLPRGAVHLMYIDTGLMRTNESAEVERNLMSLGAQNLYLIDAGERFLSALRGIREPEEKRRIIGDMFIRVQEGELQKRLKGDYLLAQGTLYTDLIESGKGVGKRARVIKSHHNVRSPLVEAKRAAGLVVEPLAKLYKDEVRRLGRTIGIREEILRRHPFPGPGLAVRIPGEITQEKCAILRAADAVFIAELKRRNLYDKIWQAFAVLLPVRSVGVAGDAREYRWVVALRAIISRDGMTADVYPFEMQDLLEISNLITNSVKQVGRVVYDISSKPPATIEWE